MSTQIRETLLKLSNIKSKKIFTESKITEESNSYAYKGFIIIHTDSDVWKIKDGKGDWVGFEFVTSEEAEEYIDSLLNEPKNISLTRTKQ